MTMNAVVPCTLEHVHDMGQLANYNILSITHQRLDINELDKFVVKGKDESEVYATLQKIQRALDIEEVQYLSTCNRVMFLLYTEQPVDRSFVERFISEVSPDLSLQDNQNLHNYVDLYRGLDAIDHIFTVVSSIDSLVVGERDILSQFKKSYKKCKEHNLIGDNIRLVEKFAIQAAKKVYAKTRIGEKPVSVVSLAVKKLMELNHPLDSKILLVGAGETIRLVAKLLLKQGYTSFEVFNRSIDNALELAEKLNAKSNHLSELNHYTEPFDVLISSTGATDVIIDKVCYDNMLNGDTSHKTIMDLAVPYNIDRAIVDNFPVNLVDLDSISALAKENLQFRRKEVDAANIILQKELEQFHQIYHQRQIEIAFRGLPSEIEQVKKRALEQVYKSDLAVLPKETQVLISNMMSYMEKKCVGIPMKVAKEVVK